MFDVQWYAVVKEFGHLIKNVGWVSGFWQFTYIQHKFPAYTNDYVDLFPWLGVVCIGMWMAWPGNHSLSIYLLHQPVLFAVFGCIAYLSNI
jgi:uncharacterized membrane protein